MRFVAALVAVAICAAHPVPMRAAPAAIGSLLVEIANRRPNEEQVKAARSQVEEVAAKIRARFDHHPKQRRFWQSVARRLAALCTRRAGKSDGGVHEWLAKAITIPGWRGVYINTTRAEAEKIVWRNDMGAGFLDLLARFGEVVESSRTNAYSIGGLTAEVNETKLTIDFSNGAQIALFGADDEKAIDKLRGQAKDEVWVDEAQKFQHLRALWLRVVSPLLKDKRGTVRLTGTPSEDCAGYFYDVTCEHDSGDVPLPGWEVHRWSVVDNPHFGYVAWIDGALFVADSDGTTISGPYPDELAAEKAATEVRWDRTAGEALTENGWKGEEPDFVREWLGKWVKEDARFVYPVHAAPQHRLVYAPQRLLSHNPINAQHARWLDFEKAVQDLPRKPNGRAYTWMFAIGADFGYAQDPFALVMWAFTPERPDIYEIFSWKQTKVLPDDQRDYLKALWGTTNNISVLVGDPAGQVLANLDGWRERTGLPIEAADKASKNTWQELMAGDIRKGNVHYREGSPLLTEHKHLVYLPTTPGKTRKDHAARRISDGSIPGNHCCFVAGTLVQTARGAVPVESVKIGDLAWTRNGLRPVVGAAQTGVRETCRLECENGATLVGTDDHPIWTDQGWIQLRSLTPDYMVLAWASTDPELSSNSTGSSIDATLSQATEPWTKIRSTTSRVTSLFSRALTTCASMLRSPTASPRSSSTSPQLVRLPLSGTDRRTASSGTASTDATLLRSALPSRSSAPCAATTSSPSIPRPRCAATTATPGSDARVASMTPTSPAPSAVACSDGTSTASPRFAPTRVRRVATTGRVEPVFNLTVDIDHEYVANGLLVSNCDAGLYSYRHLTHHMHVPKGEKPKPGTPAAMTAEEAQIEQDTDRTEAAVKAVARDEGDGWEQIDGGYSW